jgi:hypothetical protein
MRGCFLALRRVTKAAAEGKLRLAEEVAATGAARAELESAAEEFRRLHAERQALGRQWEDSLAALQRSGGPLLQTLSSAVIAHLVPVQ